MNQISMYLLTAAAPKGGAGGWQMIAMMVVVMVIFWLFFIRPQSKKQKEIQKQRDALMVGDPVVTAGGIHGTISKIYDDSFAIEVARDVQITIDKGSVYPETQIAKK